MKRFFSIVLVGVYFFLGIGLNANAHYCGGDLEQINISFSKNDVPKCEDDAEMEDDCCKDKSQQLQIKEPHQKAFHQFQFVNHTSLGDTSLALPLFFTQILFSGKMEVYAKPCNHAPPDLRSLKQFEILRYQKFGVYRI